MVIPRLKIEGYQDVKGKQSVPSFDYDNVIVDSIHIDLKTKPLDIQTYGGEYYNNCECCGEIDIDSYGIQLDDISIELDSEDTRKLFRLLGLHLKTCGHNLNELLNDEPPII